MASEVLDVTGTAMWAKVTEASRDRGSSKAEGAKYDYPEACTIDVVLGQEDLKVVKAANPKVNVNITDEGMSVKFRRNWLNGRNPKWGGVPEVVDADNNPWPEDKLIGNGSTVRVAAEVYDTQYGKGMRLLKVMVLEYVEPDLPDGPDLPF
jgi:hypothetical protein